MNNHKDVEYKDREDKINHFKMGLNLVNVNASYEMADLMYQVIKKVEEKGGKADLKDMADIQVSWERKWDKYHDISCTKQPN